MYNGTLISQPTQRRLNRTLILACIIGLFAASPGLAAQPAPTEQQSRFEIRFMEDMIDHHMMAVMMADMCIAKAVHAELKDLCSGIKAAQTAEIQQLQTWLRTWYGITYSPKMSNSGMQKLERLEGAEFEIQFMEMMSEHHAAAIEEATDCLLRAYHKQLRDLCEQIIKSQAPEINLMRTWLCQWYGQCGPVK